MPSRYSAKGKPRMEAYDFYIDVVKIIGPAFITGLTAYFVARFQFLNKKVELEKQSEFKARELLYNEYEKRIQMIQSESSNFNIQLGQLLADPLLRDEVLNSFSEAIKNKFYKIYTSEKDAENELKDLVEAGIKNEDYKRISIAYNLALEKLSNEPNVDNVKLFIAEYNPYSILQIEILNSKKEKLLVKYLGKS